MNLLEDIIGRLGALPAKERAEVEAMALKATEGMKFIPNAGPQTEAFFSPANLLLYGGAGGGGKSALLLGLALTSHKRSLIMRRQYTDLGALTEEVIRFNGGRDGFNGSAPPKLRTSDGRLIEFGAAKSLGDEQSWQGQPHDLLGFDEAVQFLEAQIRFLMGWVRSTDPKQKKRTVLASNPPITADGQWIIGMFRPWLDPTHHNPAKPGELRWYVTDPDGGDMEVTGPEPIQFAGQKQPALPQSRTFIPAALADNPFLVDTGYQATLDALPEPLRSAVRDGNFMAAKKDAANQAIPTAWVAAAQQRWTPQPPRGVPMCSIGVDASGGGDDPMVIAPRHDGWYAVPVVVPGKDLPIERLGKFSAGVIVSHRRDGAVIVLDMGGGYGGPAYEHLRENGVEVLAWKGAEGTQRRTKDRRLGFANKRSEMVWRFREALDPSQEGGSPIALPPDQDLVADLTAPTFEVGPRGIKVESKIDVVDRLGRSPDKGDAVMMGWMGGATIANVSGISQEPGSEHGRPLWAKQKTPQVILGREAARGTMRRR